MDNNAQEVVSRKIFFLYPPASVERNLDAFLEREFEVYLVKDHVALREVLGRACDSVLFANLDEGLDLEGWRDYLHDIFRDRRCSLAALRCLTARDALLESSAPGGSGGPAPVQGLVEELGAFVGHKEGIFLRTPGEEGPGAILELLEAMGARGRRKHLRAHDHGGAIRCRVDAGASRYDAVVIDLSVAGMAAIVDEAAGLSPETVLPFISLELAGIRVETRGIVATVRRDGQERPASVIMFSPASLEGQTIVRLRAIVRELHQREMERLLKGVTPA